MLTMFRDGWGDPKALAFSHPFPIFSPVFGRLYSDPGNIHNFKESNFISVRLRRIEQRQEGWQERRVIRKNHNGTILVILSPIRFLHVEFHVLP